MTRPTTEIARFRCIFCVIEIDNLTFQCPNWSYLVITSLWATARRPRRPLVASAEPEVVMTAQAPPEPAGSVELLAPNTSRTATRADQLVCESQRPAADDARDRHLALVSADARDVSRIRRLAKEFLTGLKVPPTALDDALLIISELVTNAVLHALPPAALRVRCTQHHVLRIEVTDGGPRPNPPPKTDQHEEHGRGMFIVAAMAVRYGTIAHAGGSTCWAELNP
ncbi:ATP-binding protein [Streptomyces sp. NBC_00879]|uniref:ATP-binding protein n=1 Tax=Streptomyces sp. NBC_00879 TaxID=2975855 RepID=UPI003869C719|nr:ATP-binding protein [Streptomyces sp. NBC_00879]